MKKILVFALILMMALSLFACTPATEDEPSTLPANDTPAGEPEGEENGGAEDPAAGSDEPLVYGTSADYPPFEFHILDGGQDKIVGLDVALAHQIAEDMGRTLTITDMNFDNLLTLMAKGDCDFVIAAMEKTDERLEASDASDPYYTDLPAMILVKKDNLDQYTAMDSFSGKTVGAQSGTTKADIIAEDMTGASPLLMQSVVDLVNNLVYDKCDALVLDGAVAMQYAQSDDTLAVVEAVPLGEALPYCVWVAKGDPKGLLPGINETIAKVLSDGSMERFISEADQQSSEALEN